MEIKIGKYICNACWQEWEDEHLFEDCDICGLCGLPLQSIVADRLPLPPTALPEHWLTELN